MNNTYDAFEERMKAKKAAQQADAEKNGKPELNEYPVTISLKVMADSKEAAQQTLKIVERHLNRFDDLKDAKGEML